MNRIVRLLLPLLAVFILGSAFMATPAHANYRELQMAQVGSYNSTLGTWVYVQLSANLNTSSADETNNKSLALYVYRADTGQTYQCGYMNPTTVRHTTAFDVPWTYDYQPWNIWSATHTSVYILCFNGFTWYSGTLKAKSAGNPFWSWNAATGRYQDYATMTELVITINGVTYWNAPNGGQPSAPTMHWSLAPGP